MLSVPSSVPGLPGRNRTGHPGHESHQILDTLSVVHFGPQHCQRQPSRCHAIPPRPESKGTKTSFHDTFFPIEAIVSSKPFFPRKHRLHAVFLLRCVVAPKKNRIRESKRKPARFMRHDYIRRVVPGREARLRPGCDSYNSIAKID